MRRRSSASISNASFSGSSFFLLGQPAVPPQPSSPNPSPSSSESHCRSSRRVVPQRTGRVAAQNLGRRIILNKIVAPVADDDPGCGKQSHYARTKRVHVGSGLLSDASEAIVLSPVSQMGVCNSASAPSAARHTQRDNNLPFSMNHRRSIIAARTLRLPLSPCGGPPRMLAAEQLSRTTRGHPAHRLRISHLRGLLS